jgi:hypothetical protein
MVLVEVKERWTKYLAMVRLYARVWHAGTLTKHLDSVYCHFPMGISIQ